MAMGAMRMSINEKQFIEAALRENQRIDGRTPFDFRRLVINFSKYVCMFVCLRCSSFQELKNFSSSNEERMERIFHALCSLFSVSSTTTTVEELLLWLFSFQTFLLVSALKESQKKYYYLQRR